jgi:hypothetical protein
VEGFAILALRVSDGHGRHGGRHGRRDRDIGRGPCRGRDPSGGRAPGGRDPRPNSLQSIVHRHDEAQSNERPHTEAASSNPRAICSAFPRETNSLRSRQNPGPGSVEGRGPRVEAVAARY